MAISADFTVNGLTNPRAHTAAYGSVVTLALLSTTGGSITWEIVAVSKSGDSAPAITPGGSPLGATASFTLPADPGDGLGRAFLVKSTVTNSVDSAVAYGVVGAVNANGILPIVVGEENFRNATHGWSQDLNKVLGAKGGASKFIFPLQVGAAGTSLATSSNKLLLGAVYFDPAVMAGATATFEAIIETSQATNLAYVDLYDLSTNTVVASSQLSTAALVPTRVTVSLPAVLAASARMYQARLWMAPSDSAQVVTCLYAALVIATS